jgi:glutamyl-Q tRNA(Asp) synthetase
LHFGSFVAAVASYAEARSHGGVWLVRIEDLDPPRVVAGAADDILRTLEACGLHWDGSVVYQSQRFDAYHAALHFLRKLKVIYPCACSRREIADSALAGIEGQVYPGTCRGGLASDKHVRAWRINTHGVRIAFKDVLQGKIEQDLEHEIGDFVLYRFDHVFVYQLAVVIDDAEQGITDVVRGADLLDSTPRQIYLQRLLGLPALRYMHVPVAVDHHGKKLSKQTLAAAINTKNPLPILLAALHFLGHEPPPEIATVDIATLWQWTIKHWHCSRVPREKWLSV